MLVTLLIPVTAILLGYLILGEKISAEEIVGAPVIGSALLLIDGRILKFFERQAWAHSRVTTSEWLRELQVRDGSDSRYAADMSKTTRMTQLRPEVTCARSKPTRMKPAYVVRMKSGN